ncbi:MarR family winged helix-turn-helix transcriptional regulator [Acidomonas methanolica]|uniref:MarR family winged helix-turn-helix transcriptional regulator n=1 Tax=Acidomonas methanolica TaxID=437 RepID=UPI00211A2BF0|nr:MarR family transcriptional regulator [Acidomonas methanolica]MCQ9157070.1 MarR family transcriptional regulator [Acidomonas methanolica]
MPSSARICSKWSARSPISRRCATNWPTLLSLLQNGEKRSQKELAALVKVEQPTMAQLLSRMGRDGLIRREADPDDRRSSLISLTDTAIEHLPHGRQVLRDGNADIMRGLSPEEVRTLVGLLRRVLDNIDAL